MLPSFLSAKQKRQFWKAAYAKIVALSPEERTVGAHDESEALQTRLAEGTSVARFGSATPQNVAKERASHIASHHSRALNALFRKARVEAAKKASKKKREENLIKFRKTIEIFKSEPPSAIGTCPSMRGDGTELIFKSMAVEYARQKALVGINDQYIHNHAGELFTENMAVVWFFDLVKAVNPLLHQTGSIRFNMHNFGGNNVFDLVFFSKPLFNQSGVVNLNAPDMAWVVECKFNTSGYGKRVPHLASHGATIIDPSTGKPKKVRQMTEPYFHNTLDMMLKSGDPEREDVAAALSRLVTLNKRRICYVALKTKFDTTKTPPDCMIYVDRLVFF